MHDFSAVNEDPDCAAGAGLTRGKPVSCPLPGSDRAGSTALSEAGNGLATPPLLLCVDSRWL